MTEQTTPRHGPGSTWGDHRTRTAAWASRAVTSAGPERDSVVIVLKCTLAAWLAWLVSYDLMGAETAAFAPFSAVLMMQVTVYQSVVQSLRYVAAVGAGVALQALLGFFIGPDLLTFAVVSLTALAIGRWPALGAQGTQVATAAFFAFSTYLAATTVGDRIAQLGQLVVLVLIGSGIGVLVNLLVLPPMRYRSAEYGVRRVADVLAATLEEIGPALRRDELDTDRSGHWRAQAAGVGRTVSQARTGLDTARESRHFNLRRLLRRNRQSHGFRGYESVLDALERVQHQLASLVRALDRIAEAETGPRHRTFLGRYADCADALAAPARLLAGVEETRLPAQIQELRSRLRQAETAADRLDDAAAHLDISLARGGGPPYGVLLLEAHRLLEEFQYTTEVLADSLPVAARPGR
ncbi:aromatic acid exporter family protein [Streptomyces sp. DSM 42041]|uniref:Aromatic acid exporter family protein n=1 Tax=Streptomyces hazeniae TaxID=3075538 RepID=A0ABU2NY56_9ACTN|nr:aromatic acid exporter family protein [Streptomyces sp. DSM 42041]MDT0381546.1 aromatic acid exporter family protein [Streptomyces sp. DSM 42041]